MFHQQQTEKLGESARPRAACVSSNNNNNNNSCSRRSLQEEPDSFYRHLYNSFTTTTTKIPDKTTNQDKSVNNKNKNNNIISVENEENAIRQKYEWFPPSLMKLAQVEQFFSTFAKDKIPLRARTTTTTTRPRAKQQQQNKNNKKQSQQQQLQHSTTKSQKNTSDDVISPAHSSASSSSCHSSRSSSSSSGGGGGQVNAGDDDQDDEDDDEETEEDEDNNNDHSIDQCSNSPTQTSTSSSSTTGSSLESSDSSLTSLAAANNVDLSAQASPHLSPTSAAAAIGRKGDDEQQPPDGATSSSKCKQQQQQKQGKQNKHRQKENVNPTKKQHPLLVAASSYREQQISFQLPRQDVSLDYCLYPLDDLARAAYNQFIEQRNIHSLDVGYVIEVTTTTNNNPPATTTTQHSSSASQQQQHQLSSRQMQRKASMASQLLLQPAAIPTGQVASGSSIGSGGRCRRCLIRFDHNQLAVVAPKFLINISSSSSSNLYSSSAVRGGGAKTTTSTGGGGAALPSSDRLANARAPPGGNKENLPQRGESSSAHASGGSSSSSMSMSTASPLALTSTNTTKSSMTTTTSAAAVPAAALFHPHCFTCSTCKEFLVDLVYCLRDNKLYCLRHYGESLRPRCSWCQELIFSDEYLKAMNESYHVDHFLCRHCDSNLAGQRYVLKEEKAYCISCYESNFANNCQDCQKPIGIDSRDLSYKDRHWHDTCFLCNKCQSSLIDKPFGSKADKVYCADCYDVTFATRCDGCKNPFRAGSKKMEYRGRQWHDSCFCCCVCLNTIGSNSFIPKNEEIYCIKCYEDKYATKCTKCKQVIVSGGVTFRNEPWHRECFNCCNCNKSLAGQRFTTRDVKNETVENTNKTNQPHNAYCVDCYGELFAKKCFACTQAITGLGGTRFVTFEDRSWHNDCFICNDCQTTLVGKGFITDGPETILCGDCARAKLR